MRVPVPASLRKYLGVDHAEAKPKEASTVVLVRDGINSRGYGDTEVYLLRRQPTMKFAPGAYVFPGGRVDDADRVTEVPWAGDPPDRWAERFQCDTHTARGLVSAAVRETFEESGVLLAGPDASTVVADTSGTEWQQARRELEDRTIAFAEFLKEHSLVLRTDLLGAWAHWITPAFEPRRYDTRFFVAALPTGQTVGELPGEADRGGWVALSDVLESVDAGETEMLPPTSRTCTEISRVSATTVLAAAEARTIAPRQPRLVEDGGEMFLETDLEPQ